MDKNILKQIAKRWAKGILISTDITDSETMDILSESEQEYLLLQINEIANRITKDSAAIDLNDTIKEYYETF